MEYEHDDDFNLHDVNVKRGKDGTMKIPSIKRKSEPNNVFALTGPALQAISVD